MILAARILERLPPYGPLPPAFPEGWGCLGREGLVVEFETPHGKWIGNFQPGLYGLQFAGLHPNGRDGIVISNGDLWVVSDGQLAERTPSCISAMFEVNDPPGWIFDRQGLALIRFSANGVRWHTRRISWDGFEHLHVLESRIEGMAWSPITDAWCPFEVDLQTGRTKGGSYLEDDPGNWEQLHSETEPRP